MEPMLILTIPQAAERINRSPTWIYRQIRKGGLMPTHYGSDLRLRAHVLDRYMRSVAGGSSAARRPTTKKRAARRIAKAAASVRTVPTRKGRRSRA